MMIAEIPYVLLVGGIIFIGLYASNLLYDRKVPHYISRKIGHFTAGIAFITAVLLFSSGWWPLVLAIVFTGLLWTARFVRPSIFRGVGGSGRPTKIMAEVWFSISTVLIITFGWILLDEPLVTLTCLLFMAWGDMVTGLIRSQIYHKPVKGLWGSVGMLTICSIIGCVLIDPIWIGVVGAFVATIVEAITGDTSLIPSLRWLDDNLSVPLFSALIIFGLLSTRGVI